MAKADAQYRQEATLGFITFPRDVTAQTRETAYNAYNELSKARVLTVAFDFASTEYMNSAGIGLVISLTEDANQAGRTVYAYGLTPHYRKLFNYAGLSERLILVASEDVLRQRLVEQE